MAPSVGRAGKRGLGLYRMVRGGPVGRVAVDLPALQRATRYSSVEGRHVLVAERFVRGRRRECDNLSEEARALERLALGCGMT